MVQTVVPLLDSPLHKIYFSLGNFPITLWGNMDHGPIVIVLQQIQGWW